MKSLYDKDNIEDVITDNWFRLLIKAFTKKPMPQQRRKPRKSDKTRKEYLHDYYLENVKTNPIKIAKRRATARLAKIKKKNVTFSPLILD